MRQKRAIILFTKVPLPGLTKTRLMPWFSAQQCAALHRCMLKDIYRVCSAVGADLFVCYAPKEEKGRLTDVFGKNVTYFPQNGDSLGERMENAIASVLPKYESQSFHIYHCDEVNASCRGKYDACVLVGSDVPELTEKHLEDSFSQLNRKDVVLGPSADGGYYLIGMKKLIPQAFRGQTYSHPNVLKNTVTSLAEAGYSVGKTGILRDIDRREDVEDYLRRARNHPALQRTETGKYLLKNRRISVIVPIYNEEKIIGDLQNMLMPFLKKCEIILVDGGSTDRTRELIRPEFRVLVSQKKGRASQMNLGAKESHGDILFFLHCDSELSGHFLAQIRYVLKDHPAGCFGIAFHSKNFFMWTCRVISNYRAGARKIMFGDQGIFLDRKLFFEMGMFPEIPLMEDYQFSMTLKEHGIRPGMAGKRICTSDRRYPAGTIPKLRLMWRMYRLRSMYRSGVPIEKIAEMYRDVR